MHAEVPLRSQPVHLVFTKKGSQQLAEDKNVFCDVDSLKSILFTDVRAVILSQIAVLSRNSLTLEACAKSMGFKHCTLSLLGLAAVFSLFHQGLKRFCTHINFFSSSPLYYWFMEASHFLYIYAHLYCRE